MIKVVVLVIGLWSCQLCFGEQQPSGHVNAKTSAALEQQQQHQPSPSPATTTTTSRQDATAASLDTLPTAEAVVAAARSVEDGSSSDKYSYSIGDRVAEGFSQISMYPPPPPLPLPATAFEDTTHNIYVTLPESQPLHVPYTQQQQHRFGPVLRRPIAAAAQDAKKFDENIILLEDNKGPSDSPYDTILKPLFISPDLIHIPMEDTKNEQIISPTNSPDNPSGSLADLQRLFQYTKSVVNDNDVLVINDAAAAAEVMQDSEANVRNFTNFDGENEVDQMAVESAADRNTTMMMMNETLVTAESRVQRSGLVDAATGNAGEAMDDGEDGDGDDDERQGSESKIRYTRFRKVTPIVVKAAEDDCDDEDSHGQPEAQQLTKGTPTRDYLPSKVNVEIIEDHNNGQFLKETVFIAAPPKIELEAPLRPVTSTVTTNYKTIVHTTPLPAPPPIPIGLRLTPPKSDEDCDEDHPTFKGKTIVEVQKSVSFTERRVSPSAFRSASRFSNQPSKCIDCAPPAPPTPIYLPAPAPPPPQQVIVEKPVVIDRIVEKPVQVTVEKIVNRPYPVDRIVERPVTIVKSVQVPVDRIVEKQVTKYVDRPYPVEKIVEKLVPQPYAVEKQVPVTVEKYIDRPVEVQVPVTQYVEKIVDRPVEVERIVEKQVPVPYPVEVNKYIDRPYPVEKIVERPVHIPYPVETLVEKIVDRPVETIVETPVPVEVPVPHHIHHHHVHNPHPHEHLLPTHHLHQSQPPPHVVHVEQVPYHHHHHLHGHPVSSSSSHYDYAKTAVDSATTTLLKPVHKLLGNLWSKLQSPFFGHQHTQTKHVTLPLYKTKYHTSDNNLYAGSYTGYVADSLPGGSLYNGVAFKDNNYYGPVPLAAKYEPYWNYGRPNFGVPAPVTNTIHLTPNRHNYRRHMNFLKNIRWEYGGFLPPLRPSVEIDEFGNPIHREDFDSRR